MSIDPLGTDSLITIDQAAKKVPGHPHRHSVYRWAHFGVRGHRLETVKIGRFLFTTEDALRDFLHAIQQDRPVGNPSVTCAPKKTADRKQSKAAARKRLDRAGI